MKALVIYFCGENEQPVMELQTVMTEQLQSYRLNFIALSEILNFEINFAREQKGRGPRVRSCLPSTAVQKILWTFSM